jgi:hypothetical protein
MPKMIIAASNDQPHSKRRLSVRCATRMQIDDLAAAYGVSVADIADYLVSEAILKLRAGTIAPPAVTPRPR